MISPRRPTSHKRRPRFALLRGCRFVALAVLLVVGTLRANSSYFYCAMMGQTALDACCDHHGASSEQAGYRAADCCEGRTVGSLPAAHLAVSQDVPPAPLAVLVPAASYPPVPIVGVANLYWLRWGSDPPQPSERRSQLMVYLT